MNSPCNIDDSHPSLELLLTHWNIKKEVTWRTKCAPSFIPRAPIALAHQANQHSLIS